MGTFYAVQSLGKSSLHLWNTRPSVQLTLIQTGTLPLPLGNRIKTKTKTRTFFSFFSCFFFGAFLEVFLGVSVEVLWSFFCLGVLLILVWTKLLSLFIDLCVHSTFKLLLTLPFHFLSPSFSIFLPLSFTYSLRTAQDVFPLSSTGVP